MEIPSGQPIPEPNLTEVSPELFKIIRAYLVDTINTHQNELN